MTSTFFQRLLIIILLAGTVPTLWAQEYKYEIGGMAGGKETGHQSRTDNKSARR